MQTARYRSRTDDTYIVECVQLTRANAADVFEWAPGKQHYGPGSVPTADLNVFTPNGRQHAGQGDYIYRERGTDRFWVSEPDAFLDSFVPVQAEAWERQEAAR